MRPFLAKHIFDWVAHELDKPICHGRSPPAAILRRSPYLKCNHQVWMETGNLIIRHVALDGVYAGWLTMKAY